MPFIRPQLEVHDIMKAQYEDGRTRYLCERCHYPIEVEGDSFYEFSGPEDLNFWCPNCQDLPRASLVGVAATSLPLELRLQDRFTLHIVPTAEPGDIRSYCQHATRDLFTDTFWQMTEAKKHVKNVNGSVPQIRMFRPLGMAAN